MRRIACLAALTLLLGPVGSSATASGTGDADCVDTLPSNGTGWQPKPNAGSLPRTTPRAGPDLLYADAPKAPQLQNAGIWRAEPIMISGTSAYRAGEFVYQDFVYDDTALTYPSGSQYSDNAADLVEVRLKPTASALAVRLTYNTLVDPDVAATTIALGHGKPPAVMAPHGGGALMHGNVFVTVHGCEADAVSAAGSPVPGRVSVTVDRVRRQVDLRIPYPIFDPRGRRDVSVAAAAGLWDNTTDKYMLPSSGKPAFFNVGFRFQEPFTLPSRIPGFRLDSGTGFRDGEQKAALERADLTPFIAIVDFVKLARRTDDDQPGRVGGVPTSGKMTRIYPSRFAPAQGRGTDPSGQVPAYTPCPLSSCVPPLAGQLQPYNVYVPARQRRPALGLMLYVHGRGETYNKFLDRVSHWVDVNGGDAIGVTTMGRGSTLWNFEYAAADLYEVWADVARHHELDPDRVTLSGQSLGGHATWKNIVQFPDLFAAAAINIGATAAEAAWLGHPAPAVSGDRTTVYGLLPSLRHVPVLHWVSQQDESVPFSGTKPMSDRLNELGYAHSFRAFTGIHGSTGLLLRDYDPQAAFLAQRKVVRNPAHVTHVYRPYLDQRTFGLRSDHAYWVTGLVLRERDSDASTGVVDAYSHGRRRPDAIPAPPVLTAGTYPLAAGGATAYYGNDLTPSPGRAAPPQDVLDLNVTNLKSITIWPAAAGLSCNVRIRLKSDGPVKVLLHGCPPRRETTE